MAFYFRPDDVPELQGLTRWEQRVLLRGTFVKERLISTVVLLLAVLVSVQFGINPVLHVVAPQVTNNSFPYMAVLLVWLFVLIWLRDTVMMNFLRGKIAARRAQLAAAAPAAPGNE
ncbi:hypothetical protein [Silvimonas amylolytica]|uniref:Uncharacterized protein n=1 Tax=Silvimonas amylolytica TaxID=449663 RepID=A0ABQ2PM50_9NEIS|nr:hypothetical protein [Silvimonas amylolytica]GGP26689.1 hypothetical protein GCM10010971_25080 [Silvimonas amylolytica]